ncbi:MAG TPA: PQQ-dependent sugar dehydrogenase [Nannocystaceae bacterium]|nr:PQQ-dependent sugar dehydrogenase [Nannocystaceae bacterium]
MLRRAGSIALLLTACAQPRDAIDDTDASSTSSTSDGTSGSTETSDAEPPPPRPDAIACSFEGHAPGLLPPVVAAPIAADLVGAIDLAHADARSYVLKSDGTIALLVGDDTTTLFDLSDRASRMVALALPPDHAQSGHVYVRYEAKSGSPRMVVLRLTVVDDAIDPASARVVFELNDVVGDASGGALAFDEDGRLFIGVGDGGVDPQISSARDKSVRIGKLLRIDPTTLDDTGTWAIPDDNPFVDNPSGIDETIFASGVRDPWRCTFVPGDPSPWCIDRGLAEQEIDHVEGSVDLGWPLVDGGVCRLPSGDCSDVGAAPPTAAYPLVDDDCGAAGIVVLGDAMPELAGALLTADRCSGRVRGLDLADPGTLVHEEVLGVVEPELDTLAVDDAGRVLAIGAASASALAVEPSDAVFPALLSQSRCFDDLAALVPAPGVVPYDINAPLWTDGAIKQRFMVVPPHQTIAVRDDGKLDFPIGTVLIKNFAFPTAADPDEVRVVETRVMVHHEFGWQFHTYRWDDAGTDAELLLTGLHAPIELADGTLDYDWPSRDDCRTCHGTGAAEALGPRLDQLDRTVGYGDQLAALADIGMFSAPLPDAIAAMTDYHDDTAPLEQRARAWLHGNCGHCHRPGGWVPPDLTMDLRWSTTFANTNTCDVPLQYFNGTVPGTVRMVPGDPEDSVIWQRLQMRGPGQMPPIATSRPDPAADVVHDWIASLDGCP